LLHPSRPQVGYSTTFKKHVAKQKLSAMKSHDHHIMIQQIFACLCEKYVIAWRASSNYKVEKNVSKKYA
jgi:hypothetical protein